MDIGNNIKNYRLLKNLSRKQLAESLNVSVPTISRYETGAREPNMETLNKIAKILNINISDLVGNEPIQTQQNLFTGEYINPAFNTNGTNINPKVVSCSDPNISENSCKAIPFQARMFSPIDRNDAYREMHNILNYYGFTFEECNDNIIKITKGKNSCEFTKNEFIKISIPLINELAEFNRNRLETAFNLGNDNNESKINNLALNYFYHALKMYYGNNFKKSFSHTKKGCYHLKDSNNKEIDYTTNEFSIFFNTICKEFISFRETLNLFKNNTDK